MGTIFKNALRNRFKNRFVRKPIERNGKQIAEYREDYTPRNFRASITCTLARFEAQRNENFSEILFKICKP